MKHQTPKTYVARVEFHQTGYFARQRNGQLWAIDHRANVQGGDTILITIPNPQDQFCSFVRQAPELAD